MIEHKNTILAIVLSLIVVVGWQYFIGYPQMEKQRREAAAKQQEQAELHQQPATASPSTPAPSPQGGAPAAPGRRMRVLPDRGRSGPTRYAHPHG